jgi:RNA polymerase sigma-54 factor
MHSPFGVFVLKYFLNSSVQSLDGMDEIGSLSVKEKIKDLIKNENKSKPFSDKIIVDILKRSNINIARRTVAKYREALKILPSNRRKNTYI